MKKNTISDETISAVMRELAKRRKSIGRNGGRPRTDAPRCPCGRMTARLAALRCHHCEAPAAAAGKE